MADINPRLEYTKPQSAAAIRSVQTRAELGQHIGRTLGDVLARLKAQGVQPAGPPFAHYLSLDSANNDRLDVVTGWPVAQALQARDSQHDSQIISWTLPGGRAAAATHMGSYTTIVQTCQELLTWMTRQHLEAAGSLIEQYVANPETERDHPNGGPKFTSHSTDKRVISLKLMEELAQKLRSAPRKVIVGLAFLYLAGIGWIVTLIVPFHSSAWQTPRFHHCAGAAEASFPDCPSPHW
jgi:effector-binding domain-containing protein